MPGDLRLIEFQRMSRQSWQDMMEDIHPMSPNIHVAQQNTTGWTDVLQHMFCYDTHSAPGCLASASLPCEKMTALYYHANRCLSKGHPHAQASCSAPTVASRQPASRSLRRAPLYFRSTARLHVARLLLWREAELFPTDAGRLVEASPFEAIGKVLLLHLGIGVVMRIEVGAVVLRPGPVAVT